MTDGLIKNTLQIDEYRNLYIKSLSPLFSEVVERISGLEGVELHYFRGWDEKSHLNEVFDRNSEIDSKRGYTSSGFHRAELKIYIRGRPVTEMCSRGELKSLVWALKLAQGQFLLREKTPNESKPIFLVDDLGAEFDEQHRQKIQEYLYETGHQTIITAVDHFALFRVNETISAKLFHVERGKIRN